MAATTPPATAPPTATTVLGAMRGRHSEMEQVAALLAAVGRDPADTSLGEADRVLLGLHRTLCGDDVRLVLHCGDCGADNEVRLAADELPAPAPRCAVRGTGGLREPCVADLLGLPDDPEEATAALLDRCTVGVPAQRPRPTDLELVDDSLSGTMDCACPDCGTTASWSVDVQALALRGLGRALDRLDEDVHLIASAYHWELAAIEALPDARRRRFADLIAEGRRP
ncbi:hypothetical protein [Yinghuangia seranimata]|uniref:hypothetical protein n=1 Tax=Yinghuangia seranimata TaxID=408067 RepID=UPI00248B90ED|nr:hypothetical protein [Yinghuangia seranimata]MDI2131695.1 hypothetical protein [Yinghuangia seranimata]